MTNPVAKEIKDLAKQIAEHQANIARLSEAWGERIVNAMDDSDRSTMARLKSLLENSDFGSSPKRDLERLDYIKTKLSEIRMRAFVKAEKELRSEAPDLIDNESKWSKRILSELSGEKSSSFKDITDAAKHNIINSSIITNKTWKQWWTATASADIDRISNIVFAGVSQGHTIDQMTRLIMGTKSGGYADGILSTNRAHARNLARTLCGGIANHGKDAFYRANDDIIKQVEWLSTLDGRTCSRCAGMDRERWDVNSRHPVPGLHPSCRCVLLPVTELTDLGGDSGRPRANSDFMADAEESYKEKNPSKKWASLSEATRKKYYHKAIHDYEERTGKRAFTVSGGSVTFKDYFLEMTERRKERWLGPGKYEIYKNGNLSLEKFIPPYPDPSYTVSELKAMDKKSFENAPFGYGKREKEPFTAKHDGVFTKTGKTLNDQMKKAGLPEEIRDEINWNHTEKMQHLCKVNPIISVNNNWPGVEPGTRNMGLSSKSNTFNGARPTATHEYGHYVANSIFDLEKTHRYEEFEKAVVSDWKNLRNAGWVKEYENASDHKNQNILKETLSQRMFKCGFDDLSFENQWKIIARGDILGSISAGKYGFGHGIQVYLDDWYREAFANVYLANKYGWLDYKTDFPAMWKYMEEMFK